MSGCFGSENGLQYIAEFLKALPMKITAISPEPGQTRVFTSQPDNHQKKNGKKREKKIKQGREIKNTCNSLKFL